ncbi:hypothetical protein G9A89_023882 [Geosiphon pyriformis]|nr:hypothetical protein G9A89_023882 [Geosiphon pyriformis]
MAQLVSVRNREELEITAREIQGFKSTDRINIPVNMAKEKIIDKGEIISTHQPISIPLYDQYIVTIEKKTIYRQEKCYLLQPKQLEQMNLGNLDPLQYMQLKMLFNNFNDIFANENEFGRTDIIQHQIKTEDVMPIKQRAYRILPASHEIIYQEIN